MGAKCDRKVPEQSRFLVIEELYDYSHFSREVEGMEQNRDEDTINRG